jgi:hypothetical protein
MIEGLLSLEKIERLSENIDFLLNQSNILSATEEYRKLSIFVLWE